MGTRLRTVRMPDKATEAFRPRTRMPLRMLPSSPPGPKLPNTMPRLSTTPGM